MWEIIKSLLEKFKDKPVYFVREEIPRTLGTPIRRK